ncbi:MAG: PAS domain-containing protein [Thermodesulfobacteriota bacterium]
MGDKEKIAELSAEVERLAAELVRAGQREADLADTRRAMLYLLEDINEGAALTENAKKEWEATFDSISDLLFIHDPQMRITRCNKAYMEAAGVKFKEIIGRPYYEVFPRMDGPFEPCREAPARGAGEAEEQEVEVEESGKVFKVRYYPVKGVATGASSIHVMEDITFEKRAATALKESEDKYRHLFDNLYDAAFLADAATGRIIETNKTGEALLGMTREEIIGMHQSALHPRGKEKEYREKFAAHVAKGHEADHEGEVVRKDGTVVQVAISGERLDIGGRDVMLGIFRDITVQKRNEEKIAQEMELTRDLLMIANATAHTTDIDRLMEQVVGCLKNIMRSKLSLSYVWNPERGVFSPSQAAGLSPGQTPFYRV